MLFIEQKYQKSLQCGHKNRTISLKTKKYGNVLDFNELFGHGIETETIVGFEADICFHGAKIRYFSVDVQNIGL